jgi:hypothetical protein
VTCLSDHASDAGSYRPNLFKHGPKRKILQESKTFGPTFNGISSDRCGNVTRDARAIYTGLTGFSGWGSLAFQTPVACVGAKFKGLGQGFTDGWIDPALHMRP